MLAAIGNAHHFVRDAHYAVGSLRFGVGSSGLAQFAIGVGVFVGNPFSRWAGVAVLAGNVIAQLLMIPAYPFWSLAIFALDILATYGLIAYGQRIGAS
jgi:hypothetical protein